MPAVTIYHNPRCGKSRQTLKLLQEQGIDPTIVEYLKTPPTADELKAILKKLNMEPRDLMRTKEKMYKELGIKDGNHTRDELIQLLVEHPILIERPIVIHGRQAALGRPPEAVLGIL